MKRSLRPTVIAAILAVASVATILHAQQGTLTAAEKVRRWDLENELQKVAIVEREGDDADA
jgi:hypothetical protein